MGLKYFKRQLCLCDNDETNLVELELVVALPPVISLPFDRVICLRTVFGFDSSYNAVKDLRATGQMKVKVKHYIQTHLFSLFVTNLR